MKFEVSVIIPFYENFDLLRKAINSVLSQTFKKYEIIIILDNPMLNKNLSLIKKYFNANKKIKLIINKKNLGAGPSRNKGIKLAKGKFIAFLDSDDTWKKDKLLTQLKFMKKNKSKVSHTSYDIVDINGKVFQSRKAKDLNYSNLLNSCDVGLSTVMIEKKLVQNYLFPKLKTKEDYVLWLNISKDKIIFKGIKKVLSKWTDRKNSLSKSTFQKIKDAFRVYYFYQNLNIIDSLLRVLILSINFLKKR